MAGRKYQIPDELLGAADEPVPCQRIERSAVARLARAVMMFATARCNALAITDDKQPGPAIDLSAAYFGNEMIFRANVKEIEPVDRVARGGKLQ